MKTVTIPNTANPWVCTINGVKYEYPAGSVQSVPDEVALLIDEMSGYPPDAKKPVQPWNPEGIVKPEDLASYAKSADVMPKAASITGYDATKAQTLQHDTSGALKWVDNPEEIPAE